MAPWPSNPKIFEINTWIWLSELGEKLGARIDLSSVPAAEWDAIAEFRLDAVWLMGVWERSAAGVAIANQNERLLEGFRRALPDFRPEDNVGSPYCIRRYAVDQRLGGPEGLAVARNELAQRGLRLLLDFVPNHVAPDHHWVTDHPEYFILGNSEDIRNDPDSYITIEGRTFACGRDPYFPAWPDVLQLNTFQLGLRQAVIQTVHSIASQCDGIRCDMAMLVLNGIFEDTWRNRAGLRPFTEYWVDVISAVKRAYPAFLFIAEAYWDLEWELQQQGFDFCYDKRLYDRLEHEHAQSVRLHLRADLSYQEKLARFIENHDEPRAAVTFPWPKQQAAAVTIATIPGATLFHEGQFEGRRIRVPVFLGRRRKELADQGVLAFYKRLLQAVDDPVFREGRWSLGECMGWPDNASFQNLVAWNWTKGQARRLIVVNLSNGPAQGLVHVPWGDVGGGTWVLSDLLSDCIYERNGDEMRDRGLHIELGPWMFHLFEFCRSLDSEGIAFAERSGARAATERQG